MPASLTDWLVGLGPPGPMPLDRLTACFLRFVRRHAGALREARSAGLDRSVAGWRSTLTDALRLVLRTTVASLAHLESRTPLEILWTRLRAGLPERPDIAAVLVARPIAAGRLVGRGRPAGSAAGHRPVRALDRRG